ncbi:hypothetical protein AUK40_02165 [Candidatus Wirthbacteria bacterium CG2_30_54_11]|uniref:GIY-YIG domain-containing protein n=1 Tax=Candidatus Wirthbacteria bacterium CG2_30_54_11 TaxID=1817892 RepID=A0A1J5ILG7_9BACT|nr:MAG: hypothetical protein AUK40_02165 [Candidatus Wirthbacteria bacterium CG2_30_54_11]
MWYVYVLISEMDGRRYIGCSGDLQRRMREHEDGMVASTRARRPLKLIHTEQFGSRIDAMKREKFFKTGKGREFLKLSGF